MSSHPAVRPRAAALSALAGAALVAAAMIVPRVLNEDVRVHWPPLHADWDPRWFGGASALAAVVGIVLALAAPRLARTVPWPLLLVGTYAATWAWTTVLAMTEGRDGYARVFERPGEYVRDARTVDSIPAMLMEFIDRIPMDATHNWHTHVAGHPPGALMFFVWLDRLGITDPYWIGVVVVAIGSSAVVAVLLTLRALGSVELARSAAPWLVLAPTAVWMGANGDAVFTAVAAWGLALLALACTRRSPVLAVGSGLVLGWCVFLSYGLPLLGILAVAILLIARTWQPLPWALGAALVVAAGFWAAGFAWWEAYPVLRERYYDGIASERAFSYWVWGNIAAWTFTVGLAVWAAFPAAWRALRQHDVVAQLAAAALLTIVVADLSGMSKAEVERIWMPFTIWVVVLPLLLPSRWHRPLLLTQVLLALLAQHLILTRW